MARVNIPESRRVTDVRGHIEEITARLQKEAAEQAEKEKQAQEANRAAQQKKGPAAMIQAEDEGGSSGTDVLDLTDPEGYFARLQRAQENEAREAEPAAGTKAQPEMTGKAVAAKGNPKKAPAMSGPAGKEASGKETQVGPAAREADDGQKAQPDEKVSTGPMDAAQKKTEKAVKLRTDPKEKAKDLTNASKEDIGQRVSGAAVKARIAREKAMTTAQLLFYSAREQSIQRAGEGREGARAGNEKEGPRQEEKMPATAGKELSADKNRLAGRTELENTMSGKQPSKATDKSPAHAAPVTDSRPAPADGRNIQHSDTEQPGKADRTMAGEGKSLITKAAMAMEGKRPAPAVEKQSRPEQGTRSSEKNSRGDAAHVNRMEAARPGMAQPGNTGRPVVPGMEQPARAENTRAAQAPDIGQAARTVSGPASVNAGKQENLSAPKTKSSRPEMGVTSQGKTFERFDLDKALTNAYDTSKAYRTVMEMATFTHTNGRPVAVTYNGDTLRFDKDKDGNTFAYINGTRVEPLEAARFLVRYDRATLGGAAVLVARLQLALRDPFQKGISAPAKAPVPGKGKEAEKGKGREGKAEKPSRSGRETGTGR